MTQRNILGDEIDWIPKDGGDNVHRQTASFGELGSHRWPVGSSASRTPPPKW
jgi:hypothetical protein